MSLCVSKYVSEIYLFYWWKTYDFIHLVTTDGLRLSSSILYAHECAEWARVREPELADARQVVLLGEGKMAYIIWSWEEENTDSTKDKTTQTDSVQAAINKMECFLALVFEKNQRMWYVVKRFMDRVTDWAKNANF